MKRIPPNYLLALALALAFGTSGASATATYRIVPEDSRISFSVRHFFTAVDGTFSAFEGSIQFDPRSPENASARASIDASSIDTGNRERDEHLRNEDFFHTDAFPILSFESTEWIPDPEAGEGHYRVSGNLTMRGQSHPVTLAVEYVGQSEIEPNQYRSHWNLSGSLNRSHWEIDYGKGVVGTTVEIEIELTAVSGS